MALDIDEGVREKPFRVVIHGQQGTGKSTLAADMPNPLFISGEAGDFQLDIKRVRFAKTPTERFTPFSWTELLKKLEEIRDEKKRPASTLVLDGFSSMEKLCVSHVCERNKWPGLAHPGFQKGDSAHYQEMRVMLQIIEQIWEGRQGWEDGMNLAFICHSTLKKTPDTSSGEDMLAHAPALTSFNNYDVSGTICGWADAVLFARQDVTVVKDKDMRRAFGVGGDRSISTQLSPSFVAKCRWPGVSSNIKLPREGGWKLFWGQAKGSADQIQARLIELASAANAPQDVVAAFGQFKTTKDWTNVAKLKDWIDWLQPAAAA